MEEGLDVFFFFLKKEVSSNGVDQFWLLGIRKFYGPTMKEKAIRRSPSKEGLKCGGDDKGIPQRHSLEYQKWQRGLWS